MFKKSVIFCVALTLLLTGLILYLDLTHLTGNSNGAWFTFGQNAHGALFIAQTSSIIVTCLIFIFRGGKVPRQWLVAALLSLVIIGVGFLEFYHGPRYITEVDGHSNIYYGCIINEDSTLTSNENLCVLKRIPNALELFNPIINLVLAEGIILAGVWMNRKRPISVARSKK